MKIERFKNMREDRAIDHDMMAIVRYKLFPAFNISFDEFVLYHGMKFIYENRLWYYPVWEIYLNVLMRDYLIPRSIIENTLQKVYVSRKDCCAEQREKSND